MYVYIYIYIYTYIRRTYSTKLNSHRKLVGTQHRARNSQTKFTPQTQSILVCLFLMNIDLIRLVYYLYPRGYSNYKILLI